MGKMDERPYPVYAPIISSFCQYLQSTWAILFSGAWIVRTITRFAYRFGLTGANQVRWIPLVR